MAEGRDITSEVKRIIKEQLDVDESQIKPESTFIDDLGADSLGLVELVLAFEEAFEIDIPDEDTEKIRSVQDAVSYIEKHAKKLGKRFTHGHSSCSPDGVSAGVSTKLFGARYPVGRGPHPADRYDPQ